MTRNVGKTDRIIRVIAGLALAAAAYFTGGTGGLILGAAAAAAIGTALIGWCGLYTVLGVNTCRIDKP